MLLARFSRVISVAVSLALLATLALAGSLALPRIASAHEHRQIGKYAFTVGFQNEPALLNQPNGIWVKVVQPKPGATGEAAENGKPVEGLEKTLKAEVIQGNEKMSVPLRAAFDEPGVYLGDFIPTRAGDYIFHFTGALAGQNLDQRFESGSEGENHFSGVDDVAALQFPAKPSSPQDLQASLDEARSDASQARMVGFIGIGVGGLGLLAALAALAMRRSRSASAPMVRSENV